MQRELTFCERCAHVYKPDKNDAPWRWLCIKHRRVEGFGFVTTGAWDGFPPYLYCKDVNGGQCPLYEEAEAPQEKAKSKPGKMETVT